MFPLTRVPFGVSIFDPHPSAFRLLASSQPIPHVFCDMFTVSHTEPEGSLTAASTDSVWRDLVLTMVF